MSKQPGAVHRLPLKSPGSGIEAPSVHAPLAVDPTSSSAEPAELEQFIWQDAREIDLNNSSGGARSTHVSLEATKTLEEDEPSLSGAGDDAHVGIGRPLQEAEALPRIVFSPAIRTPVSEPARDENWRQLIGVLRGADPANARMPSPSRPDMAAIAPDADADALRLAISRAISATPNIEVDHTPSALCRLSAAFRVGRRALAPHRHTAVAAGTLLAVAGFLAAAIPEIASLSASPEHSAGLSAQLDAPAATSSPEPARVAILNTPVLVREGIDGSHVGGTLAVTPGIAMPRRVRSIPVEEPARVLHPTAPAPTAALPLSIEAAPSETPVISHAAAPQTPTPLEPERAVEPIKQRPTADDDGGRAAKASPQSTRRKSRPKQRTSGRATSQKRASVETPRKSTTNPASESQQWRAPRQGLGSVSEPEEPSTLKKFFNAVWPPNLLSGNKAAEPEPMPSASVTSPATASSPIYKWSDPNRPSP